MAGFDFEAFDAWLRDSRKVKDEHRFAYRQGAERILEIAAGAPLRPAHVEEAIRREIDRGATPKAVANLRTIGDAALAFVRQRPIAPALAPPPSVEAPAPGRRSPLIIAVPVSALLAIAGLIVALYPRAKVTRERGVATLTLRTGMKCRVDALAFEYSYSWKPGAPTGPGGPAVYLVKIQTEKTRSDTLHLLHDGTTVSLVPKELREIRFYATDTSRPDDVTGLEIIDRGGRHYDFLPSNGRVLSGDGAKLWSGGKVDWWRTPEVTVQLVAPGCYALSVDLSSVRQTVNTFPVRIEFH